MKKIRLIIAAACCMMMVFTACNNKPEMKELPLDPLLEWGCSLTDVEAHMKAKVWYKDGNDSLEYWDFYEGWHKWYRVSKDYELNEQYLFMTKDGQGMFVAMFYCWSKEISFEKGQEALLGKGFNARAKTSPEAIVLSEYVSADGGTEAYLCQEKDVWWIEFYPLIY